MRKGQTEVLVVGAGPVGLWTALRLAEAGVRVTIIDREVRTTARSYACALHPRTLGLMAQAGLAETLLAQGRQVQTIAFFDGASQQAEVRLDELGGQFPFLLILPQSAFEAALEQRLRLAGVQVNWGHRFDSFTEDEQGVAVTVEELQGTSTGYIVPHWEMVVKGRSTMQAHFLVGADGHNSLVRNRLGLQSQRVSEAQFFAAFEFEPVGSALAEAKVVLDEQSTNVLWPLADNRCRWTFQLSHGATAAEFPEKERRAVRLAQPEVDERLRDYVERVARRRAPWFDAGVKTVTWCTEVAFQAQLAQHFGRTRCWLAGDAAHQTGPVGVQSMNVGLLEAEQLAGALKQGLHEADSLAALENYGRVRHQEWQGLLGLSASLQTGGEASQWVRDHAAAILPCLPASGSDLSRLAGQLNLQFASK